MRIARAREVLGSLVIDTPAVESAALVSQEGLVLASAGSHDAEMLSGIGADLLGLGNRAVETARIGRLEQTLVQGEQGTILASAAGETILLVVAGRDANLGLVLLALRRALDRVEAGLTG